jgi:hypothetical protein
VGNHRSDVRPFIASAIAILLICALSTTVPFGARTRTVLAADTVFYDFIAQAASASWSSAAGSLNFPGKDIDSQGFALYRDNWPLEDNKTWTRVLETHPQWVSNGWIMGVYPQVTVPSNAEIKVTVGFIQGATGSDGVTFEVRFRQFGGWTHLPQDYLILSHTATYDGKLDSLTASLSSLAGRTGNFILYVNAGQNSGQDWAVWAEAKIEIAPSDIEPPVVAVTYSPSDVTTDTEVTFTVRARDESAVSRIALFINSQKVKECAPPTQGIDDKGRAYWECAYTGGPYPAGQLIFQAEAVDAYGNRGVSSEGIINVAMVVVPCWFSVSGTIHNFPYSADTLKMKICQAETIVTTPGPTGQPMTITQCKEGGRVWYVDVTRRMEWDLPGPDLDYHLGGLCPGQYIVTPEFNQAAGWCEWQGSWEAAKGQVVTIENSDAEGFDFTFTPADTQGPEISLRVEPEHPEYGEQITVTILANDNRGIASIWQKTDVLGLDGSYHSGYWSSLTLVPGMEGSTAGAQFSFTVQNAMRVTVTVRVCDTDGNTRMAQKEMMCGSCHDGVQNQGETGIDCGGPCPSQCVVCLTDRSIGSAPSAYLYSLSSPRDRSVVLGAAIAALYEYANSIGVSVLDLDTGDPYGTTDNYIRAVSWWIPRHMGYRGDDLNQACLDTVLPSPYHPEDYGHGDFPVPAAYTLQYSGRAYVTDPTKQYFGDCEDFAILESAMLRSLGVCPNCIFNAEQPGHGFNIVYYQGKYRVLEPQTFAVGCEGYGPEFIWNDKVGAYTCTSFPKVRPWEYTMNYPYSQHPTVTVTGGGFRPKELWLDAWWPQKAQPAVGDFDNDGRDDIAAVYYTGRSGYPYQATVFYSIGSSFEESTTWDYVSASSEDKQFTPLVYKDPDYSDYIVAREDNILYCVGGTPTRTPAIDRLSNRFYRDPVSGAVALGNVYGDGRCGVVEFRQGDSEVYVDGDLRASGFSPQGEIPLVGDFDGDGCDDAISFERHYGGVRVIRSIPPQRIWDRPEFTMLCLWHDRFCLANEVPLVGDFNGDGRQDIASFDLDGGNVYVGLSTVFGFWSDGLSGNRARWQTDFCHRNEIPFVGDFNGDGLDDIACFKRDGSTVRVWVSLTNPSTMTYNFPGGCLCEQAHFYLDAYWPSICP